MTRQYHGAAVNLESALADLTSKIGTELHVSPWTTIAQERIDRFADATGDHQWIHVDPERARAESPFGTTIAHGYLVLSLYPSLRGPRRQEHGAVSRRHPHDQLRRQPGQVPEPGPVRSPVAGAVRARRRGGAQRRGAGRRAVHGRAGFRRQACLRSRGGAAALLRLTPAEWSSRYVTLRHTRRACPGPSPGNGSPQVRFRRCRIGRHARETNGTPPKASDELDARTQGEPR